MLTNGDIRFRHSYLDSVGVDTVLPCEITLHSKEGIQRRDDEGLFPEVALFSAMTDVEAINRISEASDLTFMTSPFTTRSWLTLGLIGRPRN